VQGLAAEKLTHCATPEDANVAGGLEATAAVELVAQGLIPTGVGCPI